MAVSHWGFDGFALGLRMLVLIVLGSQVFTSVVVCSVSLLDFVLVIVFVCCMVCLFGWVEFGF